MSSGCGHSIVNETNECFFSFPEKITSSMERDQDVVDSSNDSKRVQFGNRFLTDPRAVFEHNAW